MLRLVRAIEPALAALKLDNEPTIFCRLLRVFKRAPMAELTAQQNFRLHARNVRVSAKFPLT
jgi:hypothetical protein